LGLLDYFRPVSTWTAAQVKDFLRRNPPDRYSLVDVRQAEEYEKGHLPGARLIPVGELPDRISELEREKPVIVY
jgi:sulfur-carrier protein adenylyltransferase/sulfurtransferase